MKAQKISQILFLLAGLLTVLEFVFIQGMFTWLIAVSVTALTGIWNILLCAKNKRWLDAGLYLLASVALCMGYFVL